MSTIRPRPRVRRPHAAVGALAVALGLALCAVLPTPSVPTALAQSLRCSIYLTQQRIPGDLSERGLINFARRHRARALRETSEEELDERSWISSAVFAFNRPPGDLEFHVLFYDMEEGRQFLREMSVFLGNRQDKTVLHRIRLPRPTFKPNREHELVVTVRRQEVGRVRFETSGEEVRHTGMVDFTEGENEP
ncbi:MAG: hypothetical protein ACFCGT_06295 [Sandaracinaceae bacterium]